MATILFPGHRDHDADPVLNSLIIQDMSEVIRMIVSNGMTVRTDQKDGGIEMSKQVKAKKKRLTFGQFLANNSVPIMFIIFCAICIPISASRRATCSMRS